MDLNIWNCLMILSTIAAVISAVVAVVQSSKAKASEKQTEEYRNEVKSYYEKRKELIEIRLENEKNIKNQETVYDRVIEYIDNCITVPFEINKIINDIHIALDDDEIDKKHIQTALKHAEINGIIGRMKMDGKDIYKKM